MPVITNDWCYRYTSVRGHDGLGDVPPLSSLSRTTHTVEAYPQPCARRGSLRSPQQTGTRQLRRFFLFLYSSPSKHFSPDET